MKYHIYIDGYQITEKALTMTDIVSLYGSIRELEQAGFILRKA